MPQVVLRALEQRNKMRILSGMPRYESVQDMVEAYKADYEGWRASERAELDNHESNRSFQWIDRSRVPAGRRLVKLVWVYKVKRNGKLKSRLCVHGHDSSRWE